MALGGRTVEDLFKDMKATRVANNDDWMEIAYQLYNVAPEIAIPIFKRISQRDAKVVNIFGQIANYAANKSD